VEGSVGDAFRFVLLWYSESRDVMGSVGGVHVLLVSRFLCYGLFGWLMASVLNDGWGSHTAWCNTDSRFLVNEAYGVLFYIPICSPHSS
jgi:hypothetical protein